MSLVENLLYQFYNEEFKFPIDLALLHYMQIGYDTKDNEITFLREINYENVMDPKWDQ